MTLTYSQLEGAWIEGGGSAAAAPVAAAIAMAESAGNPMSHNGNAGTGDNSYGLWQINMIGSLGPARRAQYGLPSNEALFDPVTNARVAVAMSGNGTNWSPWTTYISGAFRRYLQNGIVPNGSGLGGSFGSAIMGSDAGSQQNATLASFTDNTCVLGWSGLGGIFGSTGHFCLLTKSEMRAMVGGLLLASGTLVMGVGAILLVLSFTSIPSAPKAISGLLSSPKQAPASSSSPSASSAVTETSSPSEDIPKPEIPNSTMKPSPVPSGGKSVTSKLSTKTTLIKALKFVL